jgi:predicted ATPase
VIATTRPELLDRRPTWGGGKANATTLSLAPLSADETLQLVRTLAESAHLPPDAEQTVVEHAGGNALYAEQYVQMWEERQTAGPLPLPESVQGLIAARLDGLPPEEKDVLQNAAVVGKVFWQGAIEAVDGIDAPTTDECLRALQRKQFVQRARRSSVRDENEYAFRHVLIRDVAYAQIPRGSRVEKHQRAAAWIESLGRPDDHAEMLAHHHVSALKLAGRPDDELTEKAVHSLVRAAERASAVNAFASAAAYYEQVLALAHADESQRLTLIFAHAHALFSSGEERRVDVLEHALAELVTAGEVDRAAEIATLLADLAWYQGHRSVVDEYLAKATALIGDRPPSPSKASVFASVARFRMLAGDFDGAISAGREALQMAESLRLEEIQAQSLISIGTARHEAGDDDGRAEIERGLELALDTNHLGAAARGYQNLSVATMDHIRQFELLQASKRLWLRLGNVDGARYAEANLAGRLYSMGHWDEALSRMDAFIAACETGQPHYQEVMQRLLRAWIRFARDDEAGAIDDLEQAVAAARVVKDPQALFGALGDAAYVYVRVGRLGEARQYAQELVGLDAQSPRRSLGFVLAAERLDMRDDVRRALADSGGPRLDPIVAAAAEGRFVDAAEIAETIHNADVAAHLRLAAGESLLGDGRVTEGAVQLREALAFYRSVGGTRVIREIETQLAAIRATVA